MFDVHLHRIRYQFRSRRIAYNLSTVCNIDINQMETKWQDFWETHQVFKAVRRPGKKKKYVLDMFPYPSAAGLHVGHPEVCFKIVE